MTIFIISCGLHKYYLLYQKNWSEIFNNRKCSLLYNLRCNTVKGIRDNFHKQFRGQIKCPFKCPHEKDTQQHVLSCNYLVKHLSDSNKLLLQNIKYTDLFGTVEEQYNITSIFLILLRIRTRLLDTDQGPACEGNNSRPRGQDICIFVYLQLEIYHHQVVLTFANYSAIFLLQNHFRFF